MNVRVNLKKTVAIVLLAAAAGYGIYRIVAQRHTSEEAQIKKLMREVKESFEQEKLKKCLAVASDDYSDNFMHDSKADLESTLRLLFRASKRISVTFEDIRIEINGDEAGIAVTVTGYADTTLGRLSFEREAGFSRYFLTVRKERGRWKVVHAEGVD